MMSSKVKEELRRINDFHKQKEAEFNAIETELLQRKAKWIYDMKKLQIARENAAKGMRAAWDKIERENPSLTDMNRTSPFSVMK